MPQDYHSQGIAPIPIQTYPLMQPEIAMMPYSTASMIYRESPSPGLMFDNIPSSGMTGLSPGTTDSSMKETVCFGMIPRIHAKCHQSGPSDFPPNFAVDLQSWDRFTSKHKNLIVHGRISPENGPMIQELLKDSSLDLDVSCSIDGPISSARPDRSITQVSCFLSITIYGPFELFDDIGDWLQDNHVHLQDPTNMGSQDVKYCNPHRLSVEDIGSCLLVSTCILQNSKLSGLEEIGDQPDYLDILSSHVDLEEAMQPEAVRTSLQRHQKQALTFMLDREKSWTFDKDGDIWEARDTHAGLQFINKVSGAVHSDEPPPFRGGIIADPMGLGKTLTMIALAATDLEPAQHGACSMVDVSAGTSHNGATLIIVPPPLLGTWQEQLSE
ncbi:hypothetical protein INS49_012111 [Diaporthe citri]|uniref:uncharacterized protein n=1 Tax=Diaporthe citri TaxID=83186 RepID=UPI001C7F30B3|nr:uncharacterized protein INS49_012111 [Diaporthe citri]KAG6358593.1 hypothetical protein INS49_012111 [Diaporthe citri]